MLVLESEKLLIILVNEVTISISVGANAINVKIIAIFIVFTNCAGSLIAATERLTIRAVSSANAKIDKTTNFQKNFLKKILFVKKCFKNGI